MRIVRLLVVANLVLSSMFFATVAETAELYGNLVLNILGSFRVPVSGLGSVKCTGFAVLAPDTSASPSLGALSVAALINSSANSASTNGNIYANGAGFSCQVIVSYFFNNVGGNQQLVVAYAVEPKDSVTNPGKTFQVVRIQNLPANGAVTTVPLQTYL